MRPHSGLSIAHVDSERGFLGGEAQVFLLLEGQRSLGHRVVLFCPPGSRGAEEASRRGIEVVPVRMRNDLDVSAVARLARGFRACGCDLVHLHTGRATWLGSLAARLAGCPALSTRRMDRRVKRNVRTRLLYRRLVRKVVAISPAVLRCLVGGGVPAERTALVHDAVDPDALRPRVGREAVRAALSAGPQDAVILTLAALIRRKGIDLLLDAAALLRERGLTPLVWIAGDGPEGGALRAQCAKLGLDPRVRFLGERGDAADLLAGADVFVLPSRREGMGVAALEAMAAARPVVCSAVGGLLTSVVDGRTGLFFPPGDVHALAHALARVLEDGALRERLGAEGPTRIREGFLARQMVEAYEEIYREILDRPRETRAQP